MSFHETLIPVAAIIIAFAAPFILRAMNKGEKNVITTNTVYNLNKNVEDLEKTVEKNLRDLTSKLDKLCAERDSDMRQINATFSEIAGNIKLHTNQIAELLINAAKLEERVRMTENDIIRNERRRTNGGT